MAKKPKKQQRVKSVVGGPYVIAAVLCENVIKQEDQVSTLIRVVDLIKFEIPINVNLDLLGPLLYQTFVFVSIRAGTFSGKCAITVTAMDDGGKEIMPELRQNWTFSEKASNGKGPGFSLAVKSVLAFTKEGRYWISVYLDDELRTRCPFDVRFERVREPSSSAILTK